MAWDSDMDSGELRSRYMIEYGIYLYVYKGNKQMRLVWQISICVAGGIGAIGVGGSGRMGRFGRNLPVTSR